MRTEQKIFNDLIETIVNNSENNEAKITNVELWAKSWKKEMKRALTLTDVVSSFIHELIKKETAIKIKLAENLDFYKGRESMQMYERTFDLWNKQNLVLWDLKDILCRMGEDLD